MDPIIHKVRSNKKCPSDFWNIKSAGCMMASALRAATNSFSFLNRFFQKSFVSFTSVTWDICSVFRIMLLFSVYPFALRHAGHPSFLASFSPAVRHFVFCFAPDFVHSRFTSAVYVSGPPSVQFTMSGASYTFICLLDLIR